MYYDWCDNISNDGYENDNRSDYNGSYTGIGRSSVISRLGRGSYRAGYSSFKNNEERQKDIDRMVETMNITYREAKDIWHKQKRETLQRQRAIQQRERQEQWARRQQERHERWEERREQWVIRQEERERQRKDKKAQYFENNPDYKFKEIMLRWDKTKGFIDYHENYEHDEEEYIPFILEEANATLLQKWNKIDEIKHAHLQNPYKFNFEILNVDFNDHEGLGSHTFTAKVTTSIPEDMEGISLIALRIEVSGSPMEGASIVLATFDKNDLTKFTGRYSIDEKTSAIKKGKIRQAYSLGSLITYQRMYVACKKNYESFSKQIFSLNADRLINNGSRNGSMSSDDYFQQLNQQQKSIAIDYINSSPGLYLLQGPPGTGKTTTICGILDYLYKENFRTLVTAPSNKAVQVIAKKFLQRTKESEQKIILIGVAGKIDQALENVFLDKLVNNFLYIQNRFKSKLDQLKISRILEVNTTNTSPVSNFSNLIREIIECLNNRWLCNQSDCEKIKSNLNGLQEELNKLLKDNKDTKQQNKYHQQYSLTQDLIKKKIDLSTTDPEQLEIKFLKLANMVFSTLSTSGRAYIIKNSIQFDHLIVDEAAQSIVPEIFIPLSTNPKHCLMVGDTQQLPATIISEANKEEYGENFSLMHQMVDNDSPIEMLTTQYRMHPEICEWPSKQCYEGKLTTAQERLNAINKEQEKLLRPLAFYNILSTEQKYGSSFYNNEEKLYAYRIVQKIRCINSSATIGIITFYKAQAEWIELFLKEQGSKKSDIKISTVDGFQGDERDFIIISCVRANKSQNVGFLDDFRRLNVAITRAKQGLYILGCTRTLEKNNTDFKLMITDLRKRELIFSEQDLNSFLNKQIPNIQFRGNESSRERKVSEITHIQKHDKLLLKSFEQSNTNQASSSSCSFRNAVSETRTNNHFKKTESKPRYVLKP